MTTASRKMIQAIEHVVKQMGVGTNLNLFNLLWAMASGAFQTSRGTVHFGLKLSGCTKQEIKRASNSLRTGKWQIGELIERWRKYVEQETDWERKEYEGWYAIVADGVVFPRLKLKGWIGKLYRGTFGKAVKAVGLGVIVDIGHYDGQRVPLLRKIVRSRNCDKSETLFKEDMLKEVARIMGPNEVMVHDAGAKIKDVRKAKIKNYLIRLAKNCVARRNYLPENAHGNREYGDEIRPLARKRNGVDIEGTNDPDVSTSFQWQRGTIKVHCWRNVVGKKDKVSDDAATYDIWVFLTLVLKSRWYWPQQSRYRPKRFLNFTLIDGLLNKCHWLRNSEWDYRDNMFLSQSAAGGCRS